QRYAHTRAIVLQEPQLAGAVRTVLGKANVLGRCEVIEIDILTHVIGVGDAYVVPCIICFCDDSQAVRVLGNCRRAMGNLAPLLLLEPVRPEQDMVDRPVEAARTADDAVYGTQRSAADYRRLLARAGFALSQIVATPGPLSVIEAHVYA